MPIKTLSVTDAPCLAISLVKFSGSDGEQERKGEMNERTCERERERERQVEASLSGCWASAVPRGSGDNN